MADEKGVLGALLLVFICVFVYFIPSIHAKNRRHPNLKSIFLLNIFLGWTLIGWVVALVWAAAAIPPIEHIKVREPESGDKYQSLGRLAELKDKGIITEKEFETEKAKLLQS
jgi:hypothetical protein